MKTIEDRIGAIEERIRANPISQEEQVGAYRRLNRSLTRKQRHDLLILIEQCIMLGATFDNVLPLMSMVMFEKPKLTPEIKAHAERIAKRLLEAKAK